MAKKHEIRNSTAEFLIFQVESKEQGVEVYYRDENIWATQKAIATLFDCDRSVVTKHLGNIFESLELKEEVVCAKFAHTAEDSKTYNTKFYSLDAIIAVGYRVNSIRATQFRQWATGASVAPHAGAWIETWCRPRRTSPHAVAPHAGAWIETFCLGSCSAKSSRH